MPQKKRKRRKRKPWRALFWFLVLIVGLALVFYLLSLPIWQIKDVVVNGTKMLSAQEIKTLAGIPLSKNLFFESFARANRNLVKITAIKSYRIYRIPPATVLISIKERRPIAALVFSHGSLFVDREGYILNRNANLSLDISDLPDLPVVSGLESKNILSSEKIDGTTTKIIVDVIIKLADFLALQKIQLELTAFEDINLLLDDVLKVKLGTAEQLKTKMQVFAALLPEIAGKWSKVHYVDVRYPANPVIKYR